MATEIILSKLYLKKNVKIYYIFRKKSYLLTWSDTNLVDIIVRLN